MIIEKDIEDALAVLISEHIATTDALVDTSIRLTTAWGYSPEGEEHAVEQPSDDVKIAIAAGAPEWDSYTTHECSVPISIAVSIRRECAPDARAVASIMEPVSNLLLALQHDSTAVDRLSYSPFTADGVRLDGGDAPAFSSTTDTWTVTRALTLRGTLDYSQP